MAGSLSRCLYVSPNRLADCLCMTLAFCDSFGKCRSYTAVQNQINSNTPLRALKE